MSTINSNMMVQLPKLPLAADPTIALFVEPLYRALNTLFQQTSQVTGQTNYDPAEWSTITPDQSLQINGTRRLYKQNTSGNPLLAGRFVYIKADDTINLADGFAGRMPIGFLTKDVPNNAWGEIIVGCGLLAANGLTPGTKYQIGALGTLTTPIDVMNLIADSGTHIVTGTLGGVVIAIAISPTLLFVNIPLY